MLEKALELGTVVLALTIEDRERMLRALDDPPTTALVELRGVLLMRTGGVTTPPERSMGLDGKSYPAKLAEHDWRVREGLV